MVKKILTEILPLFGAFWLLLGIYLYITRRKQPPSLPKADDKNSENRVS